MALATYSDLQTAVADYLVRSDLTNQIIDAIKLCESRIHYGAGMGSPFPSPPLRIRQMETSVTIPVGPVQSGVTSSGSANAQTIAISGYTLATGNLVQATIGTGLTNTGAATLNIQSTGVKAIVTAPDSAALIGGELLAGATVNFYYDGTNYVLLSGAGFPLPAGFLAARRMFLDLNPVGIVEYVQPMDFWGRWLGSTTGQPRAFTIEADTVVLGPAPATAYNTKLLYWKKFAALSGTQAQNWLLTNKPDIYLYGTLIEMQRYIADLPELPGWRDWCGLFMGAVRGLQDQDQIDRFGPGPLMMRADVSPSNNWGMQRQA